MTKLIKCVCILLIISINVYIHLFSYNDILINLLITTLSLIFCFLLGKESYPYKTYTFKYLIIYIFWNMNYLVFIKHLNTLDGIVNTFLFKNVFIDILAVLALSNIILLITKNNNYLKLILSIIFIILYIILKNNIFIYVSIFLIGNILKLKDTISIKTNIFKYLDSLNIGILIFHYLILLILLSNQLIHPNISDYIGTIVLIYVIGISTSIYIKLFPIIGEII